jgi:S-adenosylmethionine:tRNA ribosyltransferase-isomerase
MLSINDYDYELPEELIAQNPCERRDHSRLLRLDRHTGRCTHHRFEAIQEMLQPGDVLVVNDTAVLPARLYGRKQTGGRVELLILRFPQDGAETPGGRLSCECLIRAAKAPRPGTRLDFGPELSARVKAVENGRFLVEFKTDAPFDRILETRGEMPLPPYIRRPAAPADRQAYQTVYATRKGAVAAPTAGLHFTRPLLDALQSRGIEVAAVTLHVSYGTFMPIRAVDIREHRMHEESYEIGESAAAAVNLAKEEGRRIVAVGTTAVRTLEYAADPAGRVSAQHGSCNLFIYPGCRFRVVDALITNFHLPRSTLLLLVSAFAGKENLFSAYQEAIQRRYRFYSYGDAMLIDDSRFSPVRSHAV